MKCVFCIHKPGESQDARAAMSPKVKYLLATALVLTAWIVGFMMGGAFRGQPGNAQGGTAGAHNEATEQALRREAAKRVGTVEATDGEQTKREPWDRARLEAAAKGLMREGSIATIFRRAILLMDQLGPEDFPLVMEVGDGKKESDDLADIMRAFCTARWAELDPKAAAEYIMKNDRPRGWIDIDGHLLWNTWGGKDAAAAVAFAKGMKDSGNRDSALKVIVQTMARMDPDGALDFAKLHAPEMLAKGEFSRELSENALASRPEDMARRLASIPGNEGATISAIREASIRWAATNRAAALAWAQSLSEPAVRDAALAGVYQQWFHDKPHEAAAAALAEARNGGDLDEVAAVGANGWSLEDWQGAAGWAEKLPTEKERTTAYGALGERLGRDKPQAGAQWMESLPEGPAKDEAIARYVVQVESKDGAGAMAWALTISDEKKRQETSQRVVKSWFARSPASAFEWLQSSDTITPEQRGELLGK